MAVLVKKPKWTKSMRKDQRKISVSSLGLKMSKSAFQLHCPFQIPLSVSELLIEIEFEMGAESIFLLIT